jgi:hypothetical protein
MCYVFVADPTEPCEPTSWEQAKASPEWPLWKDAAQDEYDSLMDNKTWKLVDRPLHRRGLCVKAYD